MLRLYGPLHTFLSEFSPGFTKDYIISSYLHSCLNKTYSFPSCVTNFESYVYSGVATLRVIVAHA